MKNIMALMASPRVKGNTATLLGEFVKGAIEAGNDVKTLDIAKMKISGCLDCRRCWLVGDRPCVIEDDMYMVYNGIMKSDVIVFATPLYWYAPSAYLKLVMDRLLPFASEKGGAYVAGKELYLLSVAGDDDPRCFDGLVLNIGKSAELLKIKIAGSMLVTDVYKMGDMEKRQDKLIEARELGRSV